MKPKLTIARKAALRALHRGREHHTFARLNEALDRMETGLPQRLPAPYKWTKANLAREAGVHITTILFKNPAGAYRYAPILDRFDALRAKAASRNGGSGKPIPGAADLEARLQAAEQTNADKQQELARQAELICELRAKVEELEAQEAHLSSLRTPGAPT